MKKKHLSESEDSNLIEGSDSEGYEYRPPEHQTPFDEDFRVLREMNDKETTVETKKRVKPSRKKKDSDDDYEYLEEEVKYDEKGYRVYANLSDIDSVDSNYYYEEEESPQRVEEPKESTQSQQTQPVPKSTGLKGVVTKVLGKVGINIGPKKGPGSLLSQSSVEVVGKRLETTQVQTRAQKKREEEE